MDIQNKKDFLITCAYWSVIVAAVYLAFEYLVPICVPVIIGIVLAWLVVGITRKLRCTNRFVRMGLSLLIYGLIGLLVGFLAVRAVSGITELVKWLPRFYELKLQPFAMACYHWARDIIGMLLSLCQFSNPLFQLLFHCTRATFLSLCTIDILG